MLTIFLDGDLQEEVYMTQPQGFEYKSWPGFVCQLKKVLYDFKQDISSVVGFNLFIFKKEMVIVYILIYVDYILLNSPHSTFIQSSVPDLNTQLTLKDLGELGYSLGLETYRKIYISVKLSLLMGCWSKPTYKLL